MLTKMFSSCWRHDNRGATAIEYGLIAAAVSLVILASTQFIGVTIRGTFNILANAI